jgi:hypothetical protein
MNRRFSIDGDLGLAMHEPSPATAAEPKKQPAIWNFVGDFKDIAGEEAAPDAQFFVESWTQGVSAAMRNLKSRQAGAMQRGAEVSSTAAFFEQNALRDEFAATESNCSSRKAEPQSDTESEEAFDDDEILAERGPMTVRRARRILGVNLFCNERQIKAAYRHLVARWHPDRSVWATATAREHATEQMMLINEAYRMLRKNW